MKWIPNRKRLGRREASEKHAKFDVALELLISYGMISEADWKRSLGNLLVRELSSLNDYTSIIF